MPKHPINSIPSVLGFTSLIFLASCFTTTETVESVEIQTVEIKPPRPIVPEVDPLNLREVRWFVVTPENVEEVFNQLQGEAVLFAVTTEGYESLSLNISDIRAMIEQQNAVIAVYENSF